MRRPLRRVVARALGVSVRVKIMGIALGLVLLLGVGAVLQVQRVSRATLTRELDERAVSIARDTAVRAADFILFEDLVSLRDLVLDTMAASKDVRYIFVLDARANVLAHTFGHFLPPDLQPANSGDEYAGGFRIQRLASEEGILRDVAVPMFGGRAGVVRVGMSEERLERTLTRTTQQLFLLIAAVSLLGVLAAYLPTAILTRPLLELRNLTRAVGREDFSSRARVRFGDEIGQLAAAFNTMVENLERADAERSRLLDELRAKEQMRRELLEKVISAQEDERKRVARELHDETSQSLASLMVGLKVLESADRLEEARGKAGELRSVVDDVLRGVHDLAWELRPSLLDSLGLAAAIQRSAEEYGERVGLRIDCQVADLDHHRRLPPEVETAVYRIVQEALTNVAKHAQATRASVVLRHRGDSLLAIVEDDGRGFDVEAVLGTAPAEKRLGLFGMSERAALLGGRFSIESAPGRGTTVFVEVPFEGMP